MGNITPKTLISGANGLLGYDLTKHASAQNEIYGLSRSKRLSFYDNYMHIQCDISRKDFLKCLPDKIDKIYHLAQSQHFREFPEKANDIFAVNVASTQYLLDYALKAGAKKFIYTSSGGVYGYGREAFSEELDITINHDLGYYLGTKMMAEVLVRNYSNHMVTQIVRPFFMYGARQSKSMLLPRLVENVKKGVPITIQGEQGLEINPIHVSDAARAMELISQQDESGVYNLAGAETFSLLEIVRMIEDLAGKKATLEFRKEKATRLIGETRNLEKLGFKHQVPLLEGLKELINS